MTTISGGRMDERKNGAGAADSLGEVASDSTVAQTFSDVKDKAKAVTINKDGTPRKKYTRKGSAPSVPAEPSSSMGSGGFTEGQVKATFQGLFSMAALSTDCNVWFLADSEADCFVPSATLALNQTFPSVANSKWGSLTLAALSLSAVVISKTLVYADYKRRLAAEKSAEIKTEAA